MASIERDDDVGPEPVGEDSDRRIGAAEREVPRSAATNSAIAGQSSPMGASTSRVPRPRRNPDSTSAPRRRPTRYVTSATTSAGTTRSRSPAGVPRDIGCGHRHRRRLRRTGGQRQRPRSSTHSSARMSSRSLAVDLCPLLPSAANGTSRRPDAFHPRRAWIASRATCETGTRRRLASRSRAAASSSGRLIVVRFIRAY